MNNLSKVLISLVMLSSLAACDEVNKNETSQEQTEQETPETAVPEDETNPETPEVPEGDLGTPPVADLGDTTTTPEPTPEPEEPAVEKKEYINYVEQHGLYELPVEGATGYASIKLSLFAEANEASAIVTTAAPGQGFTILEELGDYWFVDMAGTKGWIYNPLCIINLADIIPSMIYDNTNTYSSMLKSSGYDIANVTGEALYDGKDFNDRLGKEEYIAGVLYGMAPKVAAAQKAALAEGNTIIMYEAFRPSDTHDVIFDNLSALVNSNADVYAGVIADGFTSNWFLAPSPYNHQRATAMDVGLAKVVSEEMVTTGDYEYKQVTEYEVYPMQTDLHELSSESAIFDTPVTSMSETAWLNVGLHENATEGSILLQGYCADAGLTPLASEWWHFNDLPNTDLAKKHWITGDYSLDDTYSTVPVAPVE